MNEKNIATKTNLYEKIIFFSLIVILAWLIVITIEVFKKEKHEKTLYTDIGKLNSIKASNTYKKLYDYHTRNKSMSLKSYKGNYSITYSPIGSVQFTVTNEYGEDITGKIENPEYINTPTVVEFNSERPMGVVTLNYKCNSNFNLQRLEITLD